MLASSFLWFKNLGLPSKTVDDIKLQIAGDYTRFNDARALALRINLNRREPDDAQILYEETMSPMATTTPTTRIDYEEYANDETYYESQNASDEPRQEVDLEAGVAQQATPTSLASTTKPTTRAKAMAMMMAASTGSKFHRVRDCPLGKGKNKKGSHNYQGKGISKVFWRWRPNLKGKGKSKSKPPWRSKGKGKGKCFGRKGHYYTPIYYEDDAYKPRGGLSISEGIPDASTPQEVATSSKEAKTTKKTSESFVIHTSSEDEDFEGYSREYTTKDHYDLKLKMNFLVFNVKKEEAQMS